MKVLTSIHTHRDPRFAFKGEKSAQMEAEDGSLVEAVVRDISVTGVALNVETPYDNGAFVQVHIEGFGQVKGSVVRAYEGGVAVQFETRQDEAAFVPTDLTA